MISSLWYMAAVNHTLLSNSERYPEQCSHFFFLLFLYLPGIDSNDFRKTVVNEWWWCILYVCTICVQYSYQLPCVFVHACVRAYVCACVCACVCVARVCVLYSQLPIDWVTWSLTLGSESGARGGMYSDTFCFWLSFDTCEIILVSLVLDPRNLYWVSFMAMWIPWMFILIDTFIYLFKRVYFPVFSRCLLLLPLLLPPPATVEGIPSTKAAGVLIHMKWRFFWGLHVLFHLLLKWWFK